MPDAFEITTSTELVGNELPHQLPAVPQLVEVLPTQPPVAGNTVTFVAADVLVQEEAVT